MRSCSSRVGLAYGCSSFSWNQARSAGSWMCMYSTPMVRQYASRSTPRILRRVRLLAPPKPPVGH